MRTFPISRGLEAQWADVDPQSRSPDLLPDPRDQGEEQHRQSQQPDRVRVLVELAVVADDDEREGEQGQAEQEPQGLGVGQVTLQAEDDGVPEPRQQHRRGQEHRIGGGSEPPNHQMRHDVAHDEQRSIGVDVPGDLPPEPQADQDVGEAPRARWPR